MTRRQIRRRLRAKIVLKNLAKFEAIKNLSYEDQLRSTLVDDIVHEARTKIGYSKNTYRFDIFYCMNRTYHQLIGK